MNLPILHAAGKSANEWFGDQALSWSGSERCCIKEKQLHNTISMIF